MRVGRRGSGRRALWMRAVRNKTGSSATGAVCCLHENLRRHRPRVRAGANGSDKAGCVGRNPISGGHSGESTRFASRRDAPCCAIRLARRCGRSRQLDPSQNWMCADVWPPTRARRHSDTDRAKRPRSSVSKQCIRRGGAQAKFLVGFETVRLESVNTQSTLWRLPVKRQVGSGGALVSRKACADPIRAVAAL